MRIVNIVASGTFGQEIDLNALTVLGERYTYNRSKYPGGYIQLSSAKVTVYRTGKYIFTGVKSLESIDSLWDEAYALLSPILDASLFVKPAVRNVVAYEDLGCQLNLINVISALRDDDEDAEYEPEVFPGLIWRTKAGSANIFQNGKIMLLGCRSEAELESLRNFVAGRLRGI